MLAAALLALAAAAQPYTFKRSTPLLDFEYSWSAEAAAVPALAHRFNSELGRIRTEMTRDSAEFAAMRRKMGDEPMAYSFSRSVTTAGQTARLLSLQIDTYQFTGGAHGNGGSSALLWDRRREREIKISALLNAGQSWDGAIRGAFCTLLDRERSKRRQEPVKRGEWPSQCPGLHELAVVLADQDKDSRFDHLEVTADPYVAGPYAEGAYEIALPVTAAMLARVRPEYRASFEAQPPVQ